MLVMGSGYTIVTPVVNQVPSIFGLSEVEVTQVMNLPVEWAG